MSFDRLRPCRCSFKDIIADVELKPFDLDRETAIRITRSSGDDVRRRIAHQQRSPAGQLHHLKDIAYNLIRRAPGEFRPILWLPELPMRRVRVSKGHVMIADVSVRFRDGPMERRSRAKELSIVVVDTDGSAKRKYL
jgi:hypothetical protein